MELTHFNEQGRARMVDVSEKVQTYRVARAAANGLHGKSDDGQDQRGIHRQG